MTQNLMARRKVLQSSSALYSSDSDTDSSYSDSQGARVRIFFYRGTGLISSC